MRHEDLVPEKALARLARTLREKAGKTRAQAARDLRVSQTSIFQAEELSAQALTKLRIRIIEKYSPCRVKGPLFLVEKK